MSTGCAFHTRADPGETKRKGIVPLRAGSADHGRMTEVRLTGIDAIDTIINIDVDEGSLPPTIEHEGHNYRLTSGEDAVETDPPVHIYVELSSGTENLE